MKSDFLWGLPVGFGRRSKQDFPRTILHEGHVERRSSQLLDKGCVNWRDTNDLMGAAALNTFFTHCLLIDQEHHFTLGEGERENYFVNCNGVSDLRNIFKASFF